MTLSSNVLFNALLSYLLILISVQDYYQNEYFYVFKPQLKWYAIAGVQRWQNCIVYELPFFSSVILWILVGCLWGLLQGKTRGFLVLRCQGPQKNQKFLFLQVETTAGRLNSAWFKKRTYWLTAITQDDTQR